MAVSARRRFRLTPAQCRFVLLLVAAAGVIVHLFVVASRRGLAPGDFDVSREFGRRFLAGSHLYEGGVHYPYMPAAAMFFAPLALLPANVAFLLRYAAALAALGLSLRWMGRMLRPSSQPAPAGTGDAIAAVTVLLGAHYIIRDLDDGGPHLILLGMLVGGMYALVRRRDVAAALCFGAAAAFKAPAGLMLPFLAWKRQWRACGLAAVATAGWIVLPAVWMGPAGWWQHQREWGASAVQGARLAEQRIQNQSLTAGIVRYLATYPPGHPLRPEHPWYRPTGAMPPARATVVAAGVVTLLLGGFLWATRRSGRGGDEDGREPWLHDASGVLILAVLLSPIVWVQHMVFAVPALYLVSASVVGGRPMQPLDRGALAAYVMLALVLNRELLGRELYLLLMAYHIHTIALLLLLFLVARLRSRPATPALRDVQVA